MYLYFFSWCVDFWNDKYVMHFNLLAHTAKAWSMCVLHFCPLGVSSRGESVELKLNPKVGDLTGTSQRALHWLFTSMVPSSCHSGFCFYGSCLVCQNDIGSLIHLWGFVFSPGSHVLVPVTPSHPHVSSSSAPPLRAIHPVSSITAPTFPVEFTPRPSGTTGMKTCPCGWDDLI